MTGQAAVFDAAALERETHVRATIVERDDAPAASMTTAVASPITLQVTESRNAHERLQSRLASDDALRVLENHR